jgi:hypothetical protein
MEAHMKSPLGKTRFGIALVLLLAAGGAAFALSAKPGPDAVSPPYNLLLEVKHDADCCQACVKIEGAKSCKTFCGKDSDDQCDAFKAESKAAKKQLAKLKKAPCYPICADQCAKTRTNVTPQQCISDCLERTRC